MITTYTPNYLIESSQPLAAARPPTRWDRRGRRDWRGSPPLPLGVHSTKRTLDGSSKLLQLSRGVSPVKASAKGAQQSWKNSTHGRSAIRALPSSGVMEPTSTALLIRPSTVDTVTSVVSRFFVGVAARSFTCELNVLSKFCSCDGSVMELKRG